MILGTGGALGTARTGARPTLICRGRKLRIGIFMGTRSDSSIVPEKIVVLLDPESVSSDSVLSNVPAVQHSRKPAGAYLAARSGVQSRRTAAVARASGK